jgi:transposase InsO family protein
MAFKLINGSVFFLTIVDDYSRFTWVHLMQHKSQVSPIIKSFFQFVQTQFKTKVKCLRSNNDAEFKMKDYFSTQGIIYQLNCVETQQQNAIIERKHQHLLNVAKALKISVTSSFKILERLHTHSHSHYKQNTYTSSLK